MTKRNMSYWAYILTNQYNTVLYVGMTNNLERRMAEHKSGTVPGFTKRYNLHKLVWTQEFSGPEEAIAAEKKIKGWTRLKKIELIEKDNKDWKDIVTQT